MNWSLLRVADDDTHHVNLDGTPAYAERFDEVLKFHAPGLAPVLRAGAAWHIDEHGSAAYPQRFLRTFGFYEDLSAVADAGGWHHIRPDGSEAYVQKFAWCGNFQGGSCTVRDADGAYFHINASGRPRYPDRWRYAGDFRDGVAVVQATDGRSTHIDDHGKLLHRQWFLDLDVFHKGFARARDDLGWMHVNGDGRATYERRFAAVEPFYNGQARVERFDGGLEVIDERGKQAVELRPTDQAQPIEGRVLARTVWGRVQLIEPIDAQPFVSKWTRCSNDREVEALLALRGQVGVPALLGRRRCDMNDQLILSFCPGDVLGDARRIRKYSEREALRVTREVLAVCAAAHEAGWVHTDIHPGNVLDGQPATLLDFACAVRASYTQPWRGEINWGVWEYVPPEQLADYGCLNPAADVYAVAALCLGMLCGEPPFRVHVRESLDAGGWTAVRDAFLDARRTKKTWDVREAVLNALVPALALDPAARPTARQLAEELQHV
jgi:hypothetical protein